MTPMAAFSGSPHNPPLRDHAIGANDSMWEPENAAMGVIVSTLGSPPPDPTRAIALGRIDLPQGGGGFEFMCPCTHGRLQ